LDLEKLLVFRIGHLGDNLVSLPAIWAVRTAFPRARIGLLSNADAKNPHYVSADKVLPKVGLIDDWFRYPTSLGKAASFRRTVNLIFELRRSKFDAVVYLMPRIRSSAQIDRDLWFFRLAGINKFIGVDYLRQTRLSEPIPTPIPTIESESLHLLHCLSHDGIPVDETNLKSDLLLDTQEIDSARSWLKSAASTPLNGRKLVAVAPGSKWKSKIWAEERFASVVKRLITKRNVFPIIFGGPEDKDKGSRLIGSWQTGVNSAGALTVRESAALLGDCSLYLGNDTGTMHLAAAVGLPCVAVFASVDWKGRWAPYGDGHHLFRKTVECEGCHTADCFNAHKCLELTGPEEVYEACLKIISAGSK
jgi:heptosyltransferase-3